MAHHAKKRSMPQQTAERLCLTDDAQKTCDFLDASGAFPQRQRVDKECFCAWSEAFGMLLGCCSQSPSQHSQARRELCKRLSCNSGTNLARQWNDRIRFHMHHLAVAACNDVWAVVRLAMRPKSSSVHDFYFTLSTPVSSRRMLREGYVNIILAGILVSGSRFSERYLSAL